jgi:hypothetical protein
MERFFILGCQRSGTTLLRLILECHPEITCLDELQSYRALAEGSLPTLTAKKKIGFKIPRWTEQLGERVLTDEGLEERALSFYRREPILFLLRDVRDTVASMIKLQAGATSWLAAYGPPILEAKIRQPAFRRRYGREIAQLRASGNALPIVAAFYWKYKTQAYFDYMECGWPILGIRYEKLVAAPEPQLRRILVFLGLPWNDQVLEHPRFPHGELYPGGATVGNTDPRLPIHAASVEQWRRWLTVEEAAAVMEVAGDLQERTYFANRTRAA